MIFLDENFLVRLLVAPQSEQDHLMVERAARLLRSALSGRREITTSEAVLAEVAYVLSGTSYRIGRTEIAAGLTRLLQLRGFKSPFKTTWMEAMEIWVNRPSLSIVDSLAAAHCIESGMEIATIDRKLSQLPGLVTYPGDNP
ncbi:MAG: type II toxin-antitoxin system VapC family toxin [Thermomicrobiales bacterium]